MMDDTEIVETVTEAGARHDVPAAATRWQRIAARVGVEDLGTAGSLRPLSILFGFNAVDELDITAFAVLAPDIRDAFGLSNAGIGSVVAVVAVVGFALAVPAGVISDRVNRVRLVRLGALLWAIFSAFTGMVPAGAVALLLLARVGTVLGKSVNAPAHRSLLADYYAPNARAAVYSAYELANPLGKVIGPLVVLILTALGFGWRVPFIVLAVPTLLVLLWSAHLDNPIRGRHERVASGVEGDDVDTEESSARFNESMRIFKGIRTLKRLWLSMPFIIGGGAAVLTLSALYYEDVFGLGRSGRSGVAIVTEIFGALGLLVGAPIATRQLARSPRRLFQLIIACALAICGGFAVLALAPVLPVAIVGSAAISFGFAVAVPGLYTMLSMVLPPKVRSLGFSFGAVFFLPGLLAIPIATKVADAFGFRAGIAMLIPVLAIGGAILASGMTTVEADIEQVRRSASADADRRRHRDSGSGVLLTCQAVDAAYGQVQVLFGVDLEVYEGEILALLGTNGAGKSTTLNAISGIVEPDGGNVFFAGQPITGEPPERTVARGIVQVPGGRGIFPGLTVEENLRMGGFLLRRRRAELATRLEEAFELFPRLAERRTQRAGSLSGGERQMLTLASSFLLKPRLLLIDELSLGLAPAVVQDLLVSVRAMNAAGMTIVVVEQSVNVALTLAERAYFLEKGEVRFSGATAELLERRDLLRSVFLEGSGGR